MSVQQQRRHRISAASIVTVVSATASAMLAAAIAAGALSAAPANGAHSFALVTLSSRPEMISGGDALVRVTLEPSMRGQEVRIALNGKDVSGSFTPDVSGDSVTGVVEGLNIGRNTLTAKTARASTSLVITNYPIIGPIFSGPHVKPFVCETEPSGLGPALDANCSIATRISYFYRSTAPAAAAAEGPEDAAPNVFKPLTEPGARPADLATVTLKNGQKLPFIVRVETGTINRGIYRIAVLDDGSAGPSSTWKPGSAWNGKLQYRFGGGCGFGRHQGRSRDIDVLDENPLSRGFAVATSTLNTYGTACDDVLSAETAMMVKEHFIERYGVPRYVVGWGGSGGAMQQYLIADNYPGILDALMPRSSFPDGQTLAHTPTDCTLLRHYFLNRHPEAAWTDAQQLSVSGFALKGNCLDPKSGWGGLAAGTTNSVMPSRCGTIIPASLAYDAAKNPTGVRCTFYESLITYLGSDPKTGFVRRPLDNVGVQYGLKALNAGVISPDQFLDLNANIGGFDQDGSFVPSRTAADTEGIVNGYRSGRVFNGKGTTLPILDLRPYRDVSGGKGDVHTKFHSYEIRKRLIDANGSGANQVMWGWGFGLPAEEHSGEALDAMDQWLENLLEDTSSTPYAARVLKARPATLTEGCWDLSGTWISEPASEDPHGRCNTLYPINGSARLVAGGPIQESIEKCSLKPVNVADYRATFTPEQQARLKQIFATGVCDYSKPGIGQQASAGKWQSYGPAPKPGR